MLTYHDIMAPVGLRINALGSDLFPGTDPSELQALYETRPLTNEMFGSSIFTFNAIRDAIIEVEGKIANTVALSADHSLRAYIASLTGALATGDPLPSVDVNGTPIIGNFGAVRDGTAPAIILKRHPVAEVERRNLGSATGLWLLDGNMYALASNRILHTQSTVLIECCVYSASAQTAAFDAMEAILFPDSLAEAYIQGALAMLIRDDEFQAQATQYANYFATTLAAIPAATMEEQAA